MLGERIGPYKFLRKIGEDPIGEVFAAVDQGSKKSVAIRALSRELSENRETIDRLHSEAKTLALLSHPHIARTYGYMRRGDRLFLITEFIEGETLQSVLEAKVRLEMPVVLAYAQQALAAAAFAHGLGVIHGELSPANVIITALGQIKIANFAVALLLGSRSRENLSSLSERYAAPERLRGEPLDARSDVYSLGAVVYECVTGRPPYSGANADGRRFSTPLAPSLLANSPAWLDAVLQKALAEEPSRRFQTAALMSDAIAAAMKASPKTAAPLRPQRSRAREPKRLALPPGFRLPAVRTAVAPRARAMLDALRQRHRSAALIMSRGTENFCAALAHGESTARKNLHSANAFFKEATRAAVRSLAAAEANLRYICSQRSTRARVVHTELARALQARLRHDLQGARLRLSSRLPTMLARAQDRLRRTLAEFSEIGWQRYAAVVIVLSAMAIEVFVFGGTSTFLMADRNEIAVSTQNGGAESFLEPVQAKHPSQPARSPQATESAPPQKTAQKPAGERTIAARPAAERQRDYNEARPAKRVVTYRMKAAEPRRVESKAPEPAPPRRAAAAPAELNVKWEN